MRRWLPPARFRRQAPPPPPSGAATNLTSSPALASAVARHDQEVRTFLDLERRLPDHAERGGVDQEAGAAQQAGDLVPTGGMHARAELLAAYVRLTFDTWRMEDQEVCASANERIHRLSDAGPPAFDRMLYAHVQVLQGDYAEALENLEAGIPKENESTSPVVHFLAFSGKALALLLSGRLGELVQLLRAGREIAEKYGNEPWLFVFREAWLRTVVFDFAGARELCEGTAAGSTAAYWQGPSQSIGGIASGYAALEQGKYDDASRCFAKVLDPSAYVGRAPQQVDEFLRTVVAPVRRKSATKKSDSSKVIPMWRPIKVNWPKVIS